MADIDSVRNAFTSRRAIRSFTSEPVPQVVIEDLLATASRAPSGSNMQPWRVWVVSGQSRADLIDVVTAEFDEGVSHGMGDYYPLNFVEPYLARRRKNGWDMYGLLGIEKGEWEKARAAHRRNYELFGAPVGLFFAIHETMRSGGWMDVGLFMQGVMTMARAHGLHTCPQAAWLEHGSLVEQHLGIPDEYNLIAGMALGYEDTDAPVNQLRTPREPVERFTVFL